MFDTPALGSERTGHSLYSHVLTLEAEMAGKQQCIDWGGGNQGPPCVDEVDLSIAVG